MASQYAAKTPLPRAMIQTHRKTGSTEATRPAEKRDNKTWPSKTSSATRDNSGQLNSSVESADFVLSVTRWVSKPFGQTTTKRKRARYTAIGSAPTSCLRATLL